MTAATVAERQKTKIATAPAIVTEIQKTKIATALAAATVATAMTAAIEIEIGGATAGQAAPKVAAETAAAAVAVGRGRGAATALLLRRLVAATPLPLPLRRHRLLRNTNRNTNRNTSSSRTSCSRTTSNRTSSRTRLISPLHLRPRRRPFCLPIWRRKRSKSCSDCLGGTTHAPLTRTVAVGDEEKVAAAALVGVRRAAAVAGLVLVLTVLISKTLSSGSG
mmetsp:Transcript_79190/g.154864  ORF Transcript_79190/g.154864 Transcript_79190/m.154864 type:complete len:221 (+) Transcript_79190:788-1450(+)